MFMIEKIFFTLIETREEELICFRFYQLQQLKLKYEKIHFNINTLCSGLINYSCDQSINPNAPFRERFILNGIMKSDTSYQIVTLTHSYQPEGYDPLGIR